jgi:hypothetical protein
LSQQESCPGCQRAVIDVRSPVQACEATGNATPQRCAWRALQLQGGMTWTPWPDAMERSPDSVPTTPAPAEAKAATPADPLAAARQQLAEEKAARTSLREQLRNAEAVAAESQALRARMFDELERKNSELARMKAEGASPAEPELDAPLRAVPEPPIVAPAPPPRRGVGFGTVLLALGALAGIALGALGTNWMRTTAEPPVAMRLDVTPPASQPAPASPDTSRASAPAMAAASTTTAPSTAASDATSGPAVALAPIGASSAAAVASSTAPTAPSVAAAAPPAPAPDASTVPPELSARLQTALSQEGVTATIGLGDDQKTVTVSDPAADRDERARTDVIIRSVFAGAQLPEPRIEHRWVSPPRAERVAGAKPEHAQQRDHVAAAAPGSLVATTKVHHGEDRDLMTLGAPAAGRAPVSDAPPPVLPFGRITASCNDRVAHASLLSKSLAMSECMRASCCDAAHAHSEECQAFGRTYPLNCPR